MATDYETIRNLLQSFRCDHPQCRPWTKIVDGKTLSGDARCLKCRELDAALEALKRYSLLIKKAEAMQATALSAVKKETTP